MTNKTRTINLEHLMNIAVPDDLYGSITGTLFIDGIDALDSPHYRSAALIGSPDTTLGLGIVYYDVAQKTFAAQKAQQGLGGTWPFGTKVSAACGVGGGLAAFAGQDETIPFVEVYRSPLSSGGPPSDSTDWSHSHTITFDNYVGMPGGVTGRVQNMLERNGKIYGFIKSKPPQLHAFFYADALQNSTATVIPYPGNAALAFLPLDVDESSTMTQRRIAFHGDDKLYTIDESYSKVLCADLTTNKVTSFLLAKPTTRSLLMHADPDPRFNKAYTGYDPDSDGYIMPYTVDPGGNFTRGENTIVGGSEVCPSLDQNLGLLYTIEVFAQAPVVDIRTDTQVTLTGDPLPTFLDYAGRPGTWVDSANSVLYLSGLNGSPTSDKLANRIAVFKASEK
ncbi:hypothetical protein [Bordetella genomosp. 11]|uniref:Uncharacterized protein n=1 Tax=Bordetella genomosp. 11 TaxID=1416808 RepID=A0A261V0J4_9BORD|nr:hypothetical protein [Bordetella genomosp. 11]OZI67040.1 hypothetical protein CAL28_04890 [Bordetella genomosp. 11]